MQKKKIVVALGHRALGNTLPEQKAATQRTARALADLVEAGATVERCVATLPRWG